MQEKETLSDLTPSNNVQGFGKIGGVRVLLTTNDFTLRAGHADGALMAKTLYMEKICVHLKLPMVKLIDGASGGGSIITYKVQQGTYISELELLPCLVQQLDLGIPQCATIVGPAVGLGAARAAVSHFGVTAANIGSLLNAGPKVVERVTFEEDLSLEDLGVPQIHCANGVIDNMAADEKGCYQQIARFLTYFPNHGGVLPPTVKSQDDSNRACIELRSVIPGRRQQMYQVRTIIMQMFDRDSWFEIGPYWENAVVVGLARLHGRPVGIIATDPLNGAGALDTTDSQKLGSHLRMCDVFGLPVVQLLDIQGFAVGTVAEESGVMRWETDLWKIYFGTTRPIFTLLTRLCYGIGGAIMADCREPNVRVAWPSSE